MADAIDRNLLVPLDTIQVEFRNELGRFVDAFNALVETYVRLQFATNTEINTGTSTTKAIHPAGLETHLRTQRFTADTVRTGTSDGSKAPRLTAAGRLDITFLPLATATDMQQGQNDTVLVTALSFAVEVAARIAAAFEDRISAGPQSAGPADEGRAPVLNEDGKLDDSYLNSVPSLYVGAMDATKIGGGLTPPIINGSNEHIRGAYTVVMVAGKYDLDAGAPSTSGIAMEPLDVLYYSGQIWERIPNPMAIEDFMRRDGSTTMTGDLTFAVLGRSVPQLQITGAIIDCGTF